MAKENLLNSQLASLFEDLEDESNGIQSLALEDLQHFPDHKFKLYEGEQLADMVTSVEEFGILMPLIVWEQENELYTILSGHNRYEAAKLAGLTEVPVIIKDDISKEEAVLIVTETNLRQRSFGDLSHSERAFALAQHYEAMKKQGKRTDILKEISELIDSSDSDSTSPQVGAKLRTDEKVGGNYGLSKNSVARYIRISTLDKSLLGKIDDGDLSLGAAYDLSFIENRELQENIADEIEQGQKIDMKKAEFLRKSYEEGDLTLEVMDDLLDGSKVEKTIKEKVMQIPKRIYNSYFRPEQSKEEVEDILEKALALYYQEKEESI